MILDLLLKNKFKIILIIGMFFLASSIVSAQFELGCCVGRTSAGDYCSAVEENECNILGGIGKWFSGPGYYDNNMNCVDLPSDYCNIICCNVDDKGVEITKIECTDKNGVFAGQKCPLELTELKWCLLNNKCDKEKTERQCKNAGGVVYNKEKDDEDNHVECVAALSKGCIISSDGKTCRAGESNTVITGESFVNTKCSEVSTCTNCGSFNWVCIDGVEHQENLCGDIIPGRACTDLEYCDKNTGRCVVDTCKADHTDKISWCEIPNAIEFPRGRHKRVECAGGGAAATTYCDEFRTTICKESVDNGKTIANCTNNEWDSCFNQNEAACNDIDHKDFCLWSNNECLPRYPPGVEFWLGDKVNQATHWNDLMCSKTSEEGCKRSGDCEGGSGVAEQPKSEEQPVQTSMPNDCGYGCCWYTGESQYAVTNNNWAGWLMKKEVCEQQVGYALAPKFLSNTICSNTYYWTNSYSQKEYDCPQNVELSSWTPKNKESGFNYDFCKCGDTFCKLSGGGICKTA